MSRCLIKASKIPYFDTSAGLITVYLKLFIKKKLLGFFGHVINSILIQPGIEKRLDVLHYFVKQSTKCVISVFISLVGEQGRKLKKQREIKVKFDLFT